MPNLKIGTAGVPLSSKDKSTLSGIKRVSQLGLGCMELEFVYGVKMTEEIALRVRSIAIKEGIDLTVHGSYYINLASEDKSKWHASINRVIKALRVGELCGAKSVTFHAAFFQGRDEKTVYKFVSKAINQIADVIDFSKFNIKLAPELTGKVSQWGDLDHLLELASDFQNIDLRFCIDFAHKLARSNGEFNGTEKTRQILSSVIDKIGQDYLDNLHMHISSINYSEKGERNHLTLFGDIAEYYDQVEKLSKDEISSIFNSVIEKKIGPGDFRWQETLEVIKEYNVGGWLICESPALELDALVLQKFFKNL